MPTYQSLKKNIQYNFKYFIAAIKILCCYRNKKSPNDMGIKTNNHENLFTSISFAKLWKVNAF